MLWRQSYQTRILRDLECPASQVVSANGTPASHDLQVWICGFGFGCFAEQGIWGRLFQSDFAGDTRVKKVFIFGSVGAVEFEALQSLVPPSELARCQFIEDPQDIWSNLALPDHPERGFAAIIDGGKIPILMVGPPTEDAWDEFSDCWRTRT